MARSPSLSPILRFTALFLVPAQLLTSPVVVLALDANCCPPGTSAPVSGQPVAALTSISGAVPASATTVHPSALVGPGVVLPSFSASPLDDEITGCHLFAEPLLPVGGISDPTDNQALVAALTAYASATGEQAAAPLEAFLAGRPQSRWAASLEANLGVAYSRACYFSKAETAFLAAWNAASASQVRTEKKVADFAAVELAELYAALGSANKLLALFGTIKGREFHGSQRQKIVDARESLNFMWAYPDHAYGCGAAALNLVQTILAPAAQPSSLLLDPDAPAGGYSLSALSALGAKANTPNTMVKVNPGAAFPVPSVVHWSWGHFSALLAVNGTDYLIKDGRLGERWVSQAALNAEASGYALVPGNIVPNGCTAVGAAEAASVVGGCHGKGCDPDHSRCPDNGCGMASYTLQLLTAALVITDTPVFYRPPRGMPIEFRVTYGQREANQPVTFTYSNLGPLWTFDWMSCVIDDPTHLSNPVKVYERGGGSDAYYIFNSTTNCYDPDMYEQAVLKRTSSSPISYQRTLTDGTIETYNLAVGGAAPRRVFLTAIQHPDGTTTSFQYDANFRLVTVTDAIGQVTTLAYGLASDIYKITSVTDPFGRTATLQYDVQGRLVAITDVVGITSQFTYGQNDFIEQLTTPYGTSHFAFGESELGDFGAARWLEATDPMGGRQRVEYCSLDNYAVPANVPTTPNQKPAGMQVYDGVQNTRNTYYWDKLAMAQGAGDYTKCHIYHWADDPNINVVSGVLESEKTPLENWVFYNYPNQSSGNSYLVGPANLPGNPPPIGRPTVVGRVLDDGTSQLYQTTYNALGLPTQRIDPAGRTTNIAYYANNVDVQQISQKNGAGSDVLVQFGAYNAQHRPASLTDASGQTTSFTYNGFGQPTTIVDPLNETTTLGYDNNGYLKSVTRPWAGAINRFSYDVVGRVATTTDSEGYVLSYAYDALNRPTTVTYPDGTFEQVVYDRLDPEWREDRLGRWTFLGYDALQRLSAVLDPQGRWTQYDWCVCGALRDIIDGNGHKTTFQRDLQGRVTSKLFNDGSAINYSYENTTSRLKTKTDVNGQIQTSSYGLDNNLSGIAYTIPGGVTPAVAATPNVSFGYDPVYDRIATVTVARGAGEVTTYGYNPVTPPAVGAGRLATVSIPSPSATISYSYDALGRNHTRSVDGAGNTTTYSYDALGRTQGVTNDLGAFAYGYLDATNRLLLVTAPGNVLATNFAYANNLGDQRLQQIQSVNPSTGNSVYSQQNYTYDAFGHILTWTQARSDRTDPEQWSFVYDNADQLTGGTQTDTTSGTVQSQYGYGYDLAGNRTLAQSGLVPGNAAYNGLNELGSIQTGGAGQMLVQGTVNKPVTGVTVNGVTASVSPQEVFQAQVPVTTGANTIAVSATDASNNQTTTKSYQVTVPAQTTRTLTSDLNGNLTSDGLNRTYQWDGANRLASIAYADTTNTTTFSYDGLGRMIKLQELNGGTVTATREFVWDGSEIVDERDGSNNVVRRYFPQGEQVVQGSGSPALLYYTRDHLGTVREAIDATGAVRARYDYDPYGVRSANAVTANAVETTFGYTAHLNYKNAIDSESAGLHLSLFRAYDPILGRWLSRDPLGEAAGIDLYAYVQGRATDVIDPLGLCISGTSLTLIGAGIAGLALALGGEGMAVAVLIGAGVGAAAGAISASMTGGSVLNGALTGAAAGGLGAAVGVWAGAAAGSAVVGGMIGGGFGSAANSVMNCKKPTGPEMMLGAAFGGVGSAAGMSLTGTPAVGSKLFDAGVGAATGLASIASDAAEFFGEKLQQWGDTRNQQLNKWMNPPP